MHAPRKQDDDEHTRAQNFGGGEEGGLIAQTDGTRGERGQNFATIHAR